MTEQPTQMTIERAREINDGIVRNRMAVIMGEEWVPFPAGSLQELLEATDLVSQNQETLNPDGTKTLHIVVDPRGIAASYAFEHFGHSPHALLEAIGYAVRRRGEDDESNE